LEIGIGGGGERKSKRRRRKGNYANDDLGQLVLREKERKRKRGRKSLTYAHDIERDTKKREKCDTMKFVTIFFLMTIRQFSIERKRKSKEKTTSRI
jgi:hypothetical protein